MDIQALIDNAGCDDIITSLCTPISKEGIPAGYRFRSPEEIIEWVQRLERVPDIRKKTRKREIVSARHIAIWLIKRKFPIMTLAGIGELFNDQDHATVKHAIKTVDEQREVSKAYREKYKAILNA